VEQAKQAELIRRVLEHVSTGTTQMVEHEDRLPILPYIQPERLEAERRLFRRLPLMLAHASQLPEPGDYLTHDATGTPLLLCRTATGEVRCFLNVCRHRRGCAREPTSSSGSGGTSTACAISTTR
jgi:hypothetical protein